MNTKPRWATKLAFIGSKPTVVIIEDEMYNFYPLSVRQVLDLKDFLPRLAKPIALLFDDSKKNDFGQKSRTVENGKKDTEDYMVTSEVVMEPSSIEMADYRSGQKQKGIEELIKIITDSQLEELVHGVIMSSMKEYIDPREAPPASTFFEQIEIPTLIQMIKGVVKANERLFEPFLGYFQVVQEKLQATLNSKLEESQETTSADDSEKKPEREKREDPQEEKAPKEM